MNRNIWWLTFLLIISIIISIFLMLHNLKSVKQNPSQKDDVNAYMNNAQYQQFYKDGSLQLQMRAAKITFHQKNETDFMKPDIKTYTANRITWYIQAEFGKSKNNNKEIELWSNVKIFQPDFPNHPQTTITTTKLLIIPEKNLAISNELVRIIRPDSITEAHGIEANFKTGTIKLLSSAHSTYFPAK